MSQYDIVVMGGGHNGLVAAAYMAKAGKKVIVLERRPHYGGGVSTRELIQPGFWHDEHSNVHIMIQGNPMLREDELGLFGKFGLEYIYPELPHASIWEDGTTVCSWRDLDRTCEEIAAFSPRDAEAYRKFVAETPEPVLERAERVTQSTFSINLTHLTLKERLRLKVGNETNAMMTELMDFYTMRDMLLEYDKLRRGEVSERLIAGGDNTIFDPSRAPEGAGVFYGVNFAPYDLWPGGPASWDERKEEIADKALAQYRKFYANLGADNITGRLIRSPVDHERDSPASFLKGDIHGCAPFFYQSVGHRPTPDLGSFRVPQIDGLYLVGPFMHPGGGVFGAGRATAIQMMDDLDIEFDKVCGERV